MTPSASLPSRSRKLGNALPTWAYMTFGLYAGQLPHERRQVAAAERIGPVVDDVEAGLLQALTGDRGRFDPELVGNVQHRDAAADAAVAAQLQQDVDDPL